MGLSLSKPAEILVGIAGGAGASELLKVAIAEAEIVLSFKSVSKELASTMKTLLPILTEIEKEEDLESLMVTIKKARVLVGKCSRVKWWNIIFKSYYSRKIQKVNRKMLKFCQIPLSLINYRNILRLAVPGLVCTDLCSVPKLDKVLVGFDWPLRELEKKILDESIDSLLVSAPPGCGKTTLVTHLCHKSTIKEHFKEHIFFCVVSRTPNFRGIVQNLLLGNGYKELTFDDDTQAKFALRALMEKLRLSGPILLVLDDVWHGAEISFLQNFQFNLPGYKILVTSRSSFPTLSSTYRLETLKDEDARSLLIQWAFGPGHTVPAEYEDVLQKILKRCNGFPLVIEVVGVSLKGKYLYAWEAQVESWSETILDDNDVKGRLQPSFDALKPPLKECFMDMGSFNEDQKIRVSVVIDIWMELHCKGSSNLYMSYLDHLASQNLLKIIPLGRKEPEDGNYNEFLVTQHDILRELAIHQSKSKEETNQIRLNLEIRGDTYPDWYLNLTKPIKARLLSISTDDLFSSKWVGMESMDCPNVEALVLNLSSSNYALPQCIATMKKLKVVIIINEDPKPAKLTGLPATSLFPNLKRIRLEKVSITLLEILQWGVHSLKKISLAMCTFGVVSHDTKDIDVSAALPNLEEIDIDYCYDLVELPNWVAEVVSLKILSITNCNKLTKLPEAIGNLSKLQVLRLKSCIGLSELPETTVTLNSLQSLDISDCLGLEKLPLEIGNLQKLKKISMRKFSGRELPESVKKLEDLEVICDEQIAFLWERLRSEMKNLTVTVVEPEHNLNLFYMF